jgi:hypothetical protein
MASADYRCAVCGHTYELLDASELPTVLVVLHDACECDELVRVWSAPHTGRGSSGEPPH